MEEKNFDKKLEIILADLVVNRNHYKLHLVASLLRLESKTFTQKVASSFLMLLPTLDDRVFKELLILLEIEDPYQNNQE